MKRELVLAKLKDAEAELRSRGVLHAALFGSIARGEERPDSDIDVLVEIDPAASVGVYEYVSLVRTITEMFPERVDVSNRAALKYYVRPTAERDAIYAF
jgi:predicted nucleotidyltransferase